VDVAFRFADGSTSAVTTVALPAATAGTPARATFTPPAGKEVVEMIIDPGTRLLATWTMTRTAGQPASTGGTR